MSKKKSTQQTTQNTTSTNSYGYVAPPETSDVAAVRNFQFTADPSIGYAFGNAKNQIANSFNNPMGGNYTPQMRDMILRSSLAGLAQQESQAKSEANQGLQGARFGQATTVANMTAPRLVQTGGTSTGTGTGTATQSGGLLESLLVGGASGAAA